jgi:DUF4097 and DUF4098 domain-containing protein YvlB
MRAPRSYWFFAVLLLFLEPLPAAGQAQDPIRIPLSDPNAPARLRCSLLAGSISVTAYDGKDILIEPRLVDSEWESEAEAMRIERDADRLEREAARLERERERQRGKSGHDEDDPVDRAAGLRRIDNFSAGLTIQEHDNEVSISGPMHNRNVDLDIKVPANTELHLGTVNDGDIVVRNVRGEIEAQNTNGRVTLTRVAGPVVAHALNGDVVASLTGPLPNRPTQLSSMNGDIDLTLPVDAKATVWIRADNGEIYTDFDLKLQAHSMRNESSDDGPPKKKKHRNEYGYQTGMQGTLNGGGAELRIVTYNGNVYIRKAK